MLVLSVGDHPELTAVVIAFTRLENDVKRQINQQTRTHLNPIWQHEIKARVRTRMDEKILAKGAKVKAGNPPVLQAGTSTRAVVPGIKPGGPTRDFARWEFGADRSKVTTYDRKSKKGGTHKVTRHTKRQMPSRVKAGRVIYPAAAETIPRAASLWVQTVVRCVHEAAEARR